MIGREAGQGNLGREIFLIIEDALVEIEELLLRASIRARSFTDLVSVSVACSSRRGCFQDNHRVRDEQPALLPELLP